MHAINRKHLLIWNTQDISDDWQLIHAATQDPANAGYYFGTRTSEGAYGPYQTAQAAQAACESYFRDLEDQ